MTKIAFYVERLWCPVVVVVGGGGGRWLEAVAAEVAVAVGLLPEALSRGGGGGGRWAVAVVACARRWWR